MQNSCPEGKRKERELQRTFLARFGCNSSLAQSVTGPGEVSPTPHWRIGWESVNGAFAVAVSLSTSTRWATTSGWAGGARESLTRRATQMWAGRASTKKKHSQGAHGQAEHLHRLPLLSRSPFFPFSPSQSPLSPIPKAWPHPNSNLLRRFERYF
jgi:hypothetical protein